jgi:hypothetical protein
MLAGTPGQEKRGDKEHRALHGKEVDEIDDTTLTEHRE